jgi:hypothetical protein
MKNFDFGLYEASRMRTLTSTNFATSYTGWGLKNAPVGATTFQEDRR